MNSIGPYSAYVLYGQVHGFDDSTVIGEHGFVFCKLPYVSV